MCKWFIGLDFKKLENISIDLTMHIQSFCDNGMNIYFIFPIRSIRQWIIREIVRITNYLVKR